MIPSGLLNSAGIYRLSNGVRSTPAAKRAIPRTTSRSPFLLRSVYSASRSYCSHTSTAIKTNMSQLFTKKDTIKCKIRVTMKLASNAPSQAQFLDTSSLNRITEDLNSIPVIQRKSTMATRLIRTVAGLTKRTQANSPFALIAGHLALAFANSTPLTTEPSLAKHYTTDNSMKTERRKKKRTYKHFPRRMFFPWVGILSLSVKCDHASWKFEIQSFSHGRAT